MVTSSGGRKNGPEPLAQHVSLLQSDYILSPQNPIKLDLVYYITKFSSENILPSWTGFNMFLSKEEVPSKSIIGYLYVIDSSPTEMDRVLTILQRSVDITDKLHLETVIIVMNQAINSKTQLIRWRNPHFMTRLAIQLGAFHIEMSLLGCLGEHLRNAGLQDILIESVVAVGSVNGIFTGSDDNRAIRAYKLMAEAMPYTHWAIYLDNIPEKKTKRVKDLMRSFLKLFQGLPNIKKF